MKHKILLFILFALISITANPIVPVSSFDEDYYPVLYEESVPQSPISTAYDIVDAWEIFISTLPVTEQVQAPAELIIQDPATINEILQQQQNVVQQTIQFLQDIMRRVYESVRNTINNLR
jgi:hypothetical protein